MLRITEAFFSLLIFGFGHLCGKQAISFLRFSIIICPVYVMLVIGVSKRVEKFQWH